MEVVWGRRERGKEWCVCVCEREIECVSERDMKIVSECERLKNIKR
jgi:hypothetical protein